MTLPDSISPKWQRRLRNIGIGLVVLVVFQGVLKFGVRMYAKAHGGPEALQALAQNKGLTLNLAIYHLSRHHYPDEREGLEAAVNPPKSRFQHSQDAIDKLLTDPWGHKLIYRCPGKLHPDSYDLISLGEDGEEGTSDDITN